MFDFNHFILHSPVRFVTSISYDSPNPVSRNSFHSIHLSKSRGGVERSPPLAVTIRDG
jgi:hypothetical protein